MILFGLAAHYFPDGHDHDDEGHGHSHQHNNNQSKKTKKNTPAKNKSNGDNKAKKSIVHDARTEEQVNLFNELFTDYNGPIFLRLFMV